MKQVRARTLQFSASYLIPWSFTRMSRVLVVSLAVYFTSSSVTGGIFKNLTQRKIKHQKTIRCRQDITRHRTSRLRDTWMGWGGLFRCCPSRNKWLSGSPSSFWVSGDNPTSSTVSSRWCGMLREREFPRDVCPTQGRDLAQNWRYVSVIQSEVPEQWHQNWVCFPEYSSCQVDNIKTCTSDQSGRGWRCLALLLVSSNQEALKSHETQISSLMHGLGNDLSPEQRVCLALFLNETPIVFNFLGLAGIACLQWHY